MKRQRSQQSPAIAQYFRTYRTREIRGTTKDKHVALRSPFDSSSPTTSPRNDTTTTTTTTTTTNNTDDDDDDDDYEYASLPITSTTQILPIQSSSSVSSSTTSTNTLTRAAVSLPNIASKKQSLQLKQPLRQLERIPTVQLMLQEKTTAITEREKYFWGQEGKEIFKAHAEEFGRTYDKTTTQRRNNDEIWTPRQLYLRDTIETGHTPVLETLPIRRNRNKGNLSNPGNKGQQSFNLSMKGITGARLSSLSSILSTIPNITHFDLESNRAQLNSGSSSSTVSAPLQPSKGLAKVFVALALRQDLLSINVADNNVSIHALTTLAREFIKKDTFSTLHTLCLRKCNLNDVHISSEVAEQLASSTTLKVLDISDNNFTSRNGALFNLASVESKIQKNTKNIKSWASLTTLIISDNTFSSEDLIQFFVALQKTPKQGCFASVSDIQCSLIPIGRHPAVVETLANVLALSSCSIKKFELRSIALGDLGKINEPSFLQFSKSLAQNNSINWLDLSHNQISSDSTIVLGNQLLLNHTLFDLYYRHGNCGRVDNMGFLLPAVIMTSSALEDAPHGRYENPEQDVFKRRHFEHVEGGDANRDYPWLTGKWTEVLFQWTPGLSGSGTDEEVFLRLGADRWWPCPMEWNEKEQSFQVWRSLPPGIYKYLFQVGGTEATKEDVDMNSFEFADDQSVETLLDKSISVFGDWTAEQLMVNCRTVQTSNHATYKKAPPRPLFAYNRRKFDEDEFKERKTPEFAEEDTGTNNKKKKKKVHAHGLIASVFAPRRASNEHEQQYYDLPTRYSKAATSDIKRMVRGGGLIEIIPMNLVEQVEQFLCDNYSLICHIHRWYASYGTGSLFAMGMNVFRLLLSNIKLIGEIAPKTTGNKKKSKARNNSRMLNAAGEKRRKDNNGNSFALTENDVVMIFKKAETSQYARKAGDKSNSVGKALDRFEFAEALVRVALRMVASKNNTREDAPTDVLEALHVLFEQHLNTYSDRSSGNAFRKKYLYITGVDSMLRKRMHLLKSVFHHYASMFSHGSGRNTMSFKEWDTLIKSALRWVIPPVHEKETMEKIVKNIFSIKPELEPEPEIEPKLEPEIEPEIEPETEVTEEAVPEIDQFGSEGGFSLNMNLDGDFDEEMEEGDPEFEDPTETDDGVNFDEWDESDEATAKAIQMIQLRMRRLLTRLRVKKLKDDKQERIRALRESSQPLQQSDGSAGVPKGQLIRRQSMRADILLLSETIRREQEAEMGKQKESHDSLIGGLGDLDVRQAFSFSQMLFIDELTASKKSHLTFCDFLEGLVRLSQTISNTMNKKMEDPNTSVNPENAWYDAEGVLHSKKETKWGKYENVGKIDEEKEVRQNVEHVARFELVLDKICSAEVKKM